MKYRVILSYEGALDFHIDAHDEEEAIKKAQEESANLTNKEFYELLEVQEYDEQATIEE